MKDIRKYMDLMGNPAPQVLTEGRKTLKDYLTETENSLAEAPKKSEIQLMASKVLPRGAKEEPLTGRMVYVKQGGLDSVATMEEKIIAKLKEVGFVKMPSKGEENIFKLDNWMVTTRVSYGGGYKYANMSAILTSVQENDSNLAEGSFVVKSLDGVEKRFKTLGPEADAWQKSLSPQAQKAEVNKDLRDQSKQKAEAMNATIWSSINGPWEWTELDWIDIVQTFIVPDLISKLKGQPVSAQVKDALIDARNGDLFALLKIFDSVTRNMKMGNSFSSWAKSMQGGRMESIEDGEADMLDEAPMSDSRKAIKQFLTANGWVKQEFRKSRQGTRTWLKQRSPKNTPKMSKEEYLTQLLADLHSNGIEGNIGDGYKRDSIIGSDWTLTVQNDTGVIGVLLSLRDTPDDGMDW
jgi:hypothetical protein